MLGGKVGIPEERKKGGKALPSVTFVFQPAAGPGCSLIHALCQEGKREEGRKKEGRKKRRRRFILPNMCLSAGDRCWLFSHMFQEGKRARRKEGRMEEKKE